MATVKYKTLEDITAEIERRFPDSSFRLFYHKTWKLPKNSLAPSLVAQYVVLPEGKADKAKYVYANSYEFRVMCNFDAFWQSFYKDKGEFADAVKNAGRWVEVIRKKQSAIR